jgi:hypothetical protein
MRTLIFLKHFTRQLSDVVRYCWVHEIWWPVPLLGLLCLAGAIAASAPIVAPYIYTLF